MVPSRSSAATPPLERPCAPRKCRWLWAQRRAAAGPSPRDHKTVPQEGALESARKGTSHGPYCYRSGQCGISDLRPRTRRQDHRRATSQDGKVRQLPQERPPSPVVLETSSEAFGLPTPLGSSDTRYELCRLHWRHPWRWCSWRENGPSRCPGTQRGILSNRFALGAHSQRDVSLVEVDLYGPRSARFVQDPADQQRSRLAPAEADQAQYRRRDDVRREGSQGPSSTRKQRTGITKAGPPRVRWALVQAAWSFRRCSKNDPLVAWVIEVEKRRGKKVAITAPFLKEAYLPLRRNAAAGVDEVTWHE